MPPTSFSAMSRTGRLLLIGFCVLALVLLIAPVRANGEPDSTGHELVANGGFEAGSEPWKFTEGAGRATNNPHSGQGLAYLDAGTGHQVAQAWRSMPTATTPRRPGSRRKAQVGSSGSATRTPARCWCPGRCRLIRRTSRTLSSRWICPPGSTWRCL